MEIESEDGSRISLKQGAKTVFGRGEGFKAEDFTVSRRHVLLEVDAAEPEPRVTFEVVGKNPVWIRREATGKVEVFRKLEKGKAEIGDRFCVSGQRPIWFTFKKCVAEREISDVDNGSDSFDISNIDPVKEFGFLVIGKEFEQYPKNRVRDVKQWDWFLDEQMKQDSDSDGDDEQTPTKGKKRTVKKRSRTKDRDDEDWTGESEEDKDVIAKSRKSQRPKYSTRLKDPKKGREAVKNGGRKRDSLEEEDNDDEDDEDDETLGGFIVGDEDGAEQEERNESDEEEEEEEEEEFEDDEDED